MTPVADRITTEQLNELVDVDPLRLRDVAVELLAERDTFRTERNTAHTALAEALGTGPSTLGQATKQAINAIHQVQRVRAIHVHHNCGDPACIQRGDCEQCGVLSPCATLTVALDGADTPEQAGLADQAQRVRDLHAPKTIEIADETTGETSHITVCQECDGIRERISDEATPILHPCTTSRALTGTETRHA